MVEPVGASSGDGWYVRGRSNPELRPGGAGQAPVTGGRGDGETEGNAGVHVPREVATADGKGPDDRGSLGQTVGEAVRTEKVVRYDPVSRSVWVNEVDSATGQVVEEIPPEAIRRMLQAYAAEQERGRRKGFAPQADGQL
ncbi:MAG: hypothetical protein K6T30_00220 [Alicyclobacillus sp.]|nr:hypothetical protein [Alicyclobacillus sp.]